VDLERRLQRFLEVEAVGGAGYTAAAAALARGGRRLGAAAAGWCDAARALPAKTTTVFDLASLTKPWVATLASVLDAAGDLPLATHVGELWPEAPVHLARVSGADLLRHRSGLRPWAPLYALCRDPAEVLEVLCDSRFAGASAGTYSDLGFVLWRALVERALARPVHELLASRAAALAEGLRQAPASGADVAWCDMGTGREVELARGLGIGIADLGPPRPGQAQDGNARFLGGIAGHAGLFGTVDALLRLGEVWLYDGAPLSTGAAAAALSDGGTFALGWWRRQPGAGAAPVLSPSSYGHTGFVGGSLWVDPERELVVAMLGHRRDPFLDLSPLRQGLHRLAIGAIETDGGVEPFP
jgi:CubicO group peptidase (beta-lactamase class C family)